MWNQSKSQFHQHYTRGFCANIFALKKSSNLKSKYKKVSNETFVQKTARKMLVKSTPGERIEWKREYAKNLVANKKVESIHQGSCLIEQWLSVLISGSQRLVVGGP